MEIDCYYAVLERHSHVATVILQSTEYLGGHELDRCVARLELGRRLSISRILGFGAA